MKAIYDDLIRQLNAETEKFSITNSKKKTLEIKL